MCVFLHDLLKISSPEDLDIEDIFFPRVITRSRIRNEVLVRFSTVSERDEVISQAVNLSLSLSLNLFRAHEERA